MPASKSSNDPMFGFLHVTDLGGGVCIGGYLILNGLGRPLEFHCTEPIKPNRAQQILYGATLEAFLYGDHIAQSLYTHSQLRPTVLVTDQLPVLAIRASLDVPVVCLANDQPLPSGYSNHRLGPNSVVVDDRYAQDLQRAQNEYEQGLPAWRLDEPFQRIGEAISELQKAA